MRTQGRLRAAPYAHEAERRQRRLMQPPKDLLGWFLQGYREEMPDRIHQAGVWRDRTNAGEAEHGIKAVGGSLLGTPRTHEGFRRLIEDSPFTTDVAEYEGHKDTANHYAFPMRAALAQLSAAYGVQIPEATLTAINGLVVPALALLSRGQVSPAATAISRTTTPDEKSISETQTPAPSATIDR